MVICYKNTNYSVAVQGYLGLRPSVVLKSRCYCPLVHIDMLETAIAIMKESFSLFLYEETIATMLPWQQEQMLRGLLLCDEM